MPVKMQKEEGLVVGQYVFIGNPNESEPLIYGRVIDHDKVQVINGNYTLRIDRATNEVVVPFMRNRRAFEIKHVGAPEIDDLNDYQAAFDWYAKVVGLTNPAK